MMLSDLGLGLLTVIILGVYIAAALWVNKDAKARNNESLMWTLVVLAAPIYGIIIYLTLGRENATMSTNIRKAFIKKPSFWLVFGLMILLGGTIGAGVTFAASHNFASAQNQRGSFTFERNPPETMDPFGQIWDMVFNPDELLGAPGDSVINGNWTFNALSANGTSTRTVRLNDNELANFHVDNTNTSGVMQLTIRQNGNTKTIDISEEHSAYIDMNEFNTGRIEIELSFGNVETVNTSISWR